MGIVAFLVILAMVILAHELGHFFTARASGVKVLEFGFGYPPRLWAFRRGGTDYSLNLLPLGGFVRMEGEEDPSAPGSLASKGMGARLLVLASGSAMNALLPVLLLALAFMIPQQVVVGGEGVKVLSVASGSPAQAAGLLPGDLILAVDGQALAGPRELGDAIQARLGAEVGLLLERPGGERVEARLVPRPLPPPGQGPLGIGLTYAQPLYETQFQPPWEAIPRGVAATGRLASAMVRGIGAMITGEEEVTLIGVIGMAQATGEVARSGFHDLLLWAAIISLSLAMLNMLPIPMLDGGRILFVLLEAVRGKRLAPERERLIHFIGFAFLMSLILVVSYFDILRLAQGEALLP